MVNILVTGGAGNIGGALCRKLVENDDYFVVIVDNLSTGSTLKLPIQEPKMNWLFINADVNDKESMEKIMTSRDFDYVFHFAAVVGVDRTQAHPLSVLDDIKGFENILELCVKTPVKRVFFSSSSEVYGEPVELPQHEDTTPLNAKLPYAIVKNVGEAYCRSYNQVHGLNYTIFRFFNTYGPNQSEDFVIPKFLSAALRGNDITIYGDGKQTRTFCYVDDNIDTCIKTMEEGLAINETINIGGAKQMSIIDLANEIINITGSKSNIVFVPPLKDGDMMRRQPDNTKMLNILGRELIPLNVGVRKMLNNKDFMKKFEKTS